MEGLDPVRLAKRQLEIDHQRTARFPDMLGRKLARMSSSPLGFLRGAAPLMTEILEARKDLAQGPPGEGWIVGDAHLENFGAYRPDPYDGDARLAGKKPATFNLNDFDEASIAPWRWDVLRLATSLVLGGRELGADGVRVLGLCEKLIESYVAAAFGGAKLPASPRPVTALIAQVQGRSNKALLDARTQVEKGQRRFVRGPRYRDLPPEIEKEVPRAFKAYTAGLPADARPTAEQLAIQDSAFRIAGTGSLGLLRIAVLVRGKGGVDGSWVFDMKEQGEPSLARLLGKPQPAPAERVASAFRACVERPPRMMGTTELRGMGMLVRRLAPQEDKLNLRQLRNADLDSLAAYLGALLGAAHARGAARGARKGWSKDDEAGMLDRAILLAGAHEATYLQLCRLARVGSA